MLVGYRWPGNVRELKNVIERTVLKAAGSTVRREDLPADVVRGAKGAPSTLTADGTPDRTERAHQAVALTSLMIRGRRESFWSIVYPLFMARDLTRGELRAIVQMGLEQTNGSYRALVELFNMPPADYKRFLGFLRKHDCHLPFQPFRATPRCSTAPSAAPPATSSTSGLVPQALPLAARYTRTHTSASSWAAPGLSQRPRTLER